MIITPFKFNLVNTLLDDGDDEDKNSAGLTLSNATLSTDIMYQVSDSPVNFK